MIYIKILLLQINRIHNVLGVQVVAVELTVLSFKNWVRSQYKDWTVWNAANTK